MHAEKLLVHLINNLFMRKFLILAGFLTSFSFAALGQTQLIQDGDFEAPIVIPPWTISGAGISVPNNPAGAHSGSHYLSLGNVAGLQVVYQSITIPADGAVGVAVNPGAGRGVSPMVDEVVGDVGRLVPDNRPGDAGHLVLVQGRLTARGVEDQ